jgi:hypothetical protein
MLALNALNARIECKGDVFAQTRTEGLSRLRRRQRGQPCGAADDDHDDAFEHRLVPALVDELCADLACGRGRGGSVYSQPADDVVCRR